MLWLHIFSLQLCIIWSSWLLWVVVCCSLRATTSQSAECGSTVSPGHKPITTSRPVNNTVTPSTSGDTRRLRRPCCTCTERFSCVISPTCVLLWRWYVLDQRKQCKASPLSHPPLVFSNSTLNPFLYYWRIPEVRLQVKQLFDRRITGKRSPRVINLSWLLNPCPEQRTVSRCAVRHW